jgi:hypothetical protein
MNAISTMTEDDEDEHNRKELMATSEKTTMEVSQFKRENDDT